MSVRHFITLVLAHAMILLPGCKNRTSHDSGLKVSEKDRDLSQEINSIMASVEDGEKFDSLFSTFNDNSERFTLYGVTRNSFKVISDRKISVSRLVSNATNDVNGEDVAFQSFLLVPNDSQINTGLSLKGKVGNNNQVRISMTEIKLTPFFQAVGTRKLDRARFVTPRSFQGEFFSLNLDLKEKNLEKLRTNVGNKLREFNSFFALIKRKMNGGSQNGLKLRGFGAGSGSYAGSLFMDNLVAITLVVGVFIVIGSYIIVNVKSGRPLLNAGHLGLVALGCVWLYMIYLRHMQSLRAHGVVR